MWRTCVYVGRIFIHVYVPKSVQSRVESFFFLFIYHVDVFYTIYVCFNDMFLSLIERLTNAYMYVDLSILNKCTCMLESVCVYVCVTLLTHTNTSTHITYARTCM